jgi:hypothetical protein
MLMLVNIGKDNESNISLGKFNVILKCEPL